MDTNKEKVYGTKPEQPENENLFKVGDEVKVYGRPGRITKILTNDAVEVEFPEIPEKDLMARTDRFYISDLDLTETEIIIRDLKSVLNEGE